MVADLADILRSAARLSGGDVRLVPDGCDYLLVGAADAETPDPAAQWLAVPATPPAGGRVLALVQTGGRGITVDGDTITFARTPVAAAYLVAMPA
jgi:hypothetical protein